MKEFNLKEGDIIYGPDRQLDGDKRKIHEFRITKVYPHIFEAGNEASQRPTI